MPLLQCFPGLYVEESKIWFSYYWNGSEKHSPNGNERRGSGTMHMGVLLGNHHLGETLQGTGLFLVLTNTT